MASRDEKASTWRSMTLFIGSSVLASLAFLWVARRLAPAEVLRQSNDVTGNYLQTLGSIYAVLLAFVVFMVWGQFNEARAQVESEANELFDVLRALRGMDPSLREPAERLVKNYADLVLDSEWKGMSSVPAPSFFSGWDVLHQLWNVVLAHEPRTDVQKILYSELLARLNDLSDARALRLGSCQVRVPLALDVLLWLGAVSTIASMGLFHVENPAPHYIMTGVLAAAVSHVLYLIRDLDNRFSGDWRVPTEPFVRVQRFLATLEPPKLLGA